jgi:ribosome-associated protein
LHPPRFGAIRPRFLGFVEIDALPRYPDPTDPAPGALRRAKRRTFVLSHSDPTTGLPVAPRPGRPASPDFTPEQILAAVLTSVDDDKAEQIVQIDLRGRSDVADYMVICSGRSSRQVAAISEKLAERLKQGFHIGIKMEGKETGDWVLIDAGDVIVHVFRPEVREFYQLEKMWQPGGHTGTWSASDI